MAVGANQGVSGSTPLTEEWSGGSWRVLPVVPVTTNYSLTSVSCVSADSCMAVGGNQYDLAVSEWWNGSTWQPVSVPNTGDIFSNLASVSCVSADSCVAVGYSWPSNDQEITMADEWNGHTWTQLAAPSTGTSLSGLSCPSATDCIAVGGYPNAAGEQVTLGEQWNGSTWQALPDPVAGLADISCPAASACLADGSQASGSDNQTIAESWNGTSWQNVSSPNPPEENGYWILTANGGVANLRRLLDPELRRWGIRFRLTLVRLARRHAPDVPGHLYHGRLMLPGSSPKPAAPGGGWSYQA
jgi:hypothetical protein